MASYEIRKYNHYPFTKKSKAFSISRQKYDTKQTQVSNRHDELITAPLVIASPEPLTYIPVAGVAKKL